MVKHQVFYSACIFSTVILTLVGIAYGVILTKTTIAPFINFDVQIADSQRKSLTTFLNELFLHQTHNHTYTTECLFSEIKKELPGLTGLTLAHNIPGRMNIKLTVDAPLLKIHQVNAEPKILLNRGDFTSLEHYEPLFLEHLPTILITEQNFNDDNQMALYRWAKSAPEDFFKKYSISWNNHNNILIYDPNNVSFEYCVTTETPYISCLEHELAEICSKLTLPLNEKNMNKKWRIDLRFKGQYIITEKNNLQKKTVKKRGVL